MFWWYSLSMLSYVNYVNVVQMFSLVKGNMGWPGGNHLFILTDFNSKAFSQSCRMDLAGGGHILSYLTPKWANEYFRNVSNFMSEWKWDLSDQNGEQSSCENSNHIYNFSPDLPSTNFDLKIWLTKKSSSLAANSLVLARPEWVSLPLERKKLLRDNTFSLNALLDMRVWK